MVSFSPAKRSARARIDQQRSRRAPERPRCERSLAARRVPTTALGRDSEARACRARRCCVLTAARPLPRGEAAVQHRDARVPEPAQQPPQPRRVGAVALIVGDDLNVGVDAPAAEGRGERARGSGSGCRPLCARDRARTGRDRGARRARPGCAPAAYALAPQSGRARSKRQSTTRPVAGRRGAAASSASSISVVYMSFASVSPPIAFSAARRCRYNRRSDTCEASTDGDRRLLGQRQSVRVAGAARARVQAAAVHEPPAAVLQAGAQVAADARAQLARPGAGAQGRRLCRVSSRWRCCTTWT